MDIETVQYSNLTELFENHALTYNVHAHINTAILRPTDLDDSMWRRLDGAVKQWIYYTISTDLLQTILTKGSTALETWNRLQDIFQDNKKSRVIYLENIFTSISIEQFFNAAMLLLIVND